MYMNVLLFQLSTSDNSRVRENSQSNKFDFNEVSGVPPTTTDAQSGSKKKRSSMTASKRPKPRKRMAPRSIVWKHFTRLAKN